MPKISRVNGPTRCFEGGPVEREATPEPLAKLSIHLPAAGVSLADTVSVLGSFGVERVRSRSTTGCRRQISIYRLAAHRIGSRSTNRSAGSTTTATGCTGQPIQLNEFLHVWLSPVKRGGREDDRSRVRNPDCSPSPPAGRTAGRPAVDQPQAVAVCVCNGPHGPLARFPVEVVDPPHCAIDLPNGRHVVAGRIHDDLAVGHIGDNLRGDVRLDHVRTEPARVPLGGLQPLQRVDLVSARRAISPPPTTRVWQVVPVD